MIFANLNRYYLFLLVVLISCSSEEEAPQGTHSYTYQIPDQINDGWQVSSLESEGINQTGLEDMINYIYNHGLNQSVKDIIIVKNGKLVFEEYFGTTTRETLVHLQSATKSLTSVIFGIAIDQLHVGSVDESVYSYFPEYLDSVDSPKNEILLHHMLTMTPGLEWNETSTSLFSGENDNIAGHQSGDYIGHLLGKNLVAEPGSTWNYNSGCAMVLAGIIKKATGFHIDEFGEEYLFDPLGIEDYRWEYQQDGLPIAMGGFWMKPRAMAKIGELFLRGGVWDEKRILSDTWIRASFTEHKTVNDDWDYGYQWWAGQANSSIGESFENKIWYAHGYGGQMIIVIQESKVVIVTNGAYSTDTGRTKKTEGKIWQLLRTFIFPSLMEHDQTKKKNEA